MKYVPKPVDTNDIHLSEDVQDLTEFLAEHAHEVWSRQRLADGWVWGEKRDDDTKQHPCLIPYDQLDDSEKQYDRNAAIETLKVILAKGYRIIPPPGGRKAHAGNEAAASARADAMLRSMQAAQYQASGASSSDRAELELPVLLQVWNARREDDRAWSCEPELYRHLSQRFLKLGQPPLAREVAQTALELAEVDSEGVSRPIWKHDVKLRQIFALALARTGSPDAAQSELIRLRREKNVDEETLGILARTYKDQAYAPTVEDDERERLLRIALERYREAWELSDGFWTGINVATLERLLDNGAESEKVAEQVKRQCLEDLESKRSKNVPAEQTYWHLATLGEVALNAGDFEQAGERYREAYEVAPNNFGDLRSTRRHAGWLIDHWIAQQRLGKSDQDLLDQWLPIPSVVVFSGHLIDAADRPTPRFPPELASSVSETLRTWIEKNHALVGYSSAACGSDLLFQREIQRLGGESRIVIPYDSDQFKIDSVSFAGEQWSELYDQVLAGATQVVVASPKRAQGDGISYDYANLVLHGLATVRASELESNNSEPIGLVVWNGDAGDGMGGTASVVKRWSELGMRVEQVDVSSVSADHQGAIPVVANPKPPEVICEGPGCDVADTRIMAMMFGDAVNFSHLDEQQVGRFIQHFMSPIAAIVRKYGDANVVSNTWGDGIYLVFDHVREAGKCALDICDFTREQIAADGWTKHRLPANLNVRMALHAGPVFGCVDPITEQKNYTGTHVSRAARLEPKTPPGEVYASEAFAALCAEYRVQEFSCQYIKQLAWAKHYGSFPTFVLRRRS